MCIRDSNPTILRVILKRQKMHNIRINTSVGNYLFTYAQNIRERRNNRNNKDDDDNNKATTNNNNNSLLANRKA